MKYYYKVVSTDSHKNLKSVMGRKKSICCLMYPLNRWVKPKIGKIFIFDTLGNANSFLLYGCKIYKCLAVGVYPIKFNKIPDPPVFLRNRIIPKFWKVKGNKNREKFFLFNKNAGGIEPPTGTLLAEKVKLIMEEK